MTERCPSCGGLVSADAEWCGQCYANLRAPPGSDSETAEQEARPGPRPDRPRPDRPRERSGATPSWTCPVCEAENPLEADRCGSCGTSFASVLREDEEPAIDADRARMLSYLFPGLGHIRAGLSAEGLARVVSFAWVLGALVSVVLARRGQDLGAAWLLVTMYALAAAALYLVTPLDAERAVSGREPLLSSRALLIGLVVLIAMTLALPFLL